MFGFRGEGDLIFLPIAFLLAGASPSGKWGQILFTNRGFTDHSLVSEGSYVVHSTTRRRSPASPTLFHRSQLTGEHW